MLLLRKSFPSLRDLWAIIILGETAEAVLEKINLLKKSILARAFRGELDTNDPTEESAVELLKQFL